MSEAYARKDKFSTNQVIVLYSSRVVTEKNLFKLLSDLSNFLNLCWKTNNVVRDCIYETFQSVLTFAHLNSWGNYNENFVIISRFAEIKSLCREHEMVFADVEIFPQASFHIYIMVPSLARG